MPLICSRRYLAENPPGRRVERMRWSARCTAEVSWQVSTRPVRWPSSRIGRRLLTTMCWPRRITVFSSPTPPRSTSSNASSGQSSCRGRPSIRLAGIPNSASSAGFSDCTMPRLSTAATPVGMCCSTPSRCRRLAISMRWLCRIPSASSSALRTVPWLKESTPCRPARSASSTTVDEPITVWQPRVRARSTACRASSSVM
ncbi:hypothetical protein D3C86_1521900 [compost metagenome]